MTMYIDKPLRCVTCGADFVFTAGEQQFHAAKGFTNEPRHCQACRQARRGARGSSARAGEPSVAVGGDNSSVARSEPQPAPSDQSSAPATGDSARGRFATTCSACGGEAILPFEPMGNRPVLCSACYDKIRALA